MELVPELMLNPMALETIPLNHLCRVDNLGLVGMIAFWAKAIRSGFYEYYPL